MALQRLLSNPITGVQPYDELPITAQIWSEAHGHHHQHRVLHALAAHRPGILYGLHVSVDPGNSNTLVLSPGVAVDTVGRTIIVSRPMRFQLTLPDEVYVILQYDEGEDPEAQVQIGGGVVSWKLVEYRKAYCSTRLPAEPHLEVARIKRTAPDHGARNAANPFDPGADEVNLLYRLHAFPHCAVSGGVGEISYVPSTGDDWKPNRPGLCHLLRSAASQGFALSFRGAPDTGLPPSDDDPILMYMSGKEGYVSFAPSEIGWLRNYLSAGGFLMAEAAGGSAQFRTSFQATAASLGANLRPLGPRHPLLSAFHVFAEAPVGAGTGEILIDDSVGVLFSTVDYGAAWQGALGRKDANSREVIRAAHEFGMNVIAYAAARRR